MATGTINTSGAVFSSEHVGSITVEAGGNSTLSCSITVPPGNYLVWVNCFIVGTSSTRSVTKVFINENGSHQGTATFTQCTLSASTEQRPLVSLKAFSFTEQTVLTPYVTVTGSDVNFADRQAIYALKVA